MSHPLFFSSEVTRRGLGRCYFEAHARDHGETSLLKRPNLRRVVRHHAHAAEAEVEEYLRALVVTARVHFQTQLLVSLDCVRAFILQGVSANLVDDADAAPLLLLIDDDAEPFVRDALHRRP